jgi:hypothetical protein
MASGASAELKFLMNRESVDSAVQDLVVNAGVKTVKHFASLAKDTEDMRDLAKQHFGLGETSLATKVNLSCLICAFNSAKARAAEMDKLDAENEVRAQPKVIPSSDFLAMREAFKSKYWPLEDSRTPARSYIEKKLEGLEKNDFRAETLSEVINYREDDARELRPVWDLSGALKSMKTQTTVPLPRDTEELRARISLMGTAWVFTSFQQTGNKVLENIDPFVFSSYVDYLLGVHVWGLVAKGADGSTFAGPGWPLLLSYEQEIRAYAYSLVCNEGVPLKDALVKAWQDETVKGSYFVTPLALQSTKRHLEHPGSVQPSKFQRMDMPKGKGKGKRNKKGKGKSTAPSNCASKTPDGKGICFDFNKNGCSRSAKECRFEHVCGVCFRKGSPMGQCAHKA